MEILAATDFSKHSRAAVRWGALLAEQPDATLIVGHVVDLAAGDNAWRVLVETPEEIEQSSLVEAKQRLAEYYAEAVGDEPEGVELLARLGSPVDELVAEAEKRGDVVTVVGTRGESRLKELFLGNTARRLVRRSESPVMLVPPQAPVQPPERIVVGVDFSDPSRQAIRWAAAIARAYDATVHAVYGYVLPEVATVEGTMLSGASDYDELVDEKRQALEQIIHDQGAGDVVEELSAIHKSPERAIVDTAEDEEAQMIFVGTHGREGFRRFFLGNTAERVMRRSPCAVFVTPAEAEPEEQ